MAPDSHCVLLVCQASHKHRRQIGCKHGLGGRRRGRGRARGQLATIDFLARGGDQYPFGDATITPLGISYQQALSRLIEEDLDGKVTAAAYLEAAPGASP